MAPEAYTFDAPSGRDPEQERLARQAQLYDPVTERTLRAAGIGAGMRVLDLGSGAGDVTMLAARLVGPTGRVVGVERDPDAVVSARARAWEAGVDTVAFVEGDVGELTLDDSFDAVVGRLILMHVDDPAAVLATAATVLRPGGIVCVHEISGSALSEPETPLFAEVSRIICAAFARTGAAIDMSSRLHATFRAAGLPAPQLRYERLAGGAEQPYTEYLRDTLVALTPIIEREQLATAEQLGVETLVERLDAELESTGAIVTLWPMVGAWARV